MRWVIAVFMTAAACLAQARVDEFLGVKNWHGTIRVTGSGSGTSKGGGYSDVWQFGTTSKFDITLDTFGPNGQSWPGTFKGTSKMHATAAATRPNCTQKLNQ